MSRLAGFRSWGCYFCFTGYSKNMADGSISRQTNVSDIVVIWNQTTAWGSMHQHQQHPPDAWCCCGAGMPLPASASACSTWLVPPKEGAPRLASSLLAINRYQKSEVNSIIQTSIISEFRRSAFSYYLRRRGETGNAPKLTQVPLYSPRWAHLGPLRLTQVPLNSIRSSELTQVLINSLWSPWNQLGPLSSPRFPWTHPGPPAWVRRPARSPSRLRIHPEESPPGRERNFNAHLRNGAFDRIVLYIIEESPPILDACT